MEHILAFIAPSVASEEIYNLFSRGIPHNYHTGRFFNPRKQNKMSIVEKAFIVNSCLEDFESGFLLGPFSPDLEFVK